jgi:hypothetical protein
MESDVLPIQRAWGGIKQNQFPRDILIGTVIPAKINEIDVLF